MNSINAISSLVQAAYGPEKPNQRRSPAPVVDAPQSRAEGAAPRAPTAAFLPNVTLRYQVNSEDNSVTLLVVDVSTRKVLRTVPPEELARIGFDHIMESLA